MEKNRGKWARGGPAFVPGCAKRGASKESEESRFLTWASGGAINREWGHARAGVEVVRGLMAGEGDMCLSHILTFVPKSILRCKQLG